MQLRTSILKMTSRIFAYDNLTDAHEYLTSKLNGFSPKVGVICGSGLSSLTKLLDGGSAVAKPISYSELPHFAHLIPTVAGHAGRLHFGHILNVPAVIADGRIHPYEGYSVQECCLPIWLMRKLGVSHLFLTNANGSCLSTHRLGSLILLRDHIDLPSMYAGSNPYFGLRDERFWSGDFGSGTQFVPLHQIYDESLRMVAHKVAKTQNWSLHEFDDGVYARVCGPMFDTTSERRLLRDVYKVDVFGMSTTYEAALGVACSMRVLALSVVTEIDPTFAANSPSNDAAAHKNFATSHLDVLRESEKVVDRIVFMFREIIRAEFEEIKS